jgi:hypothetical protein
LTVLGKNQAAGSERVDGRHPTTGKTAVLRCLVLVHHLTRWPGRYTLAAFLLTVASAPIASVA